MVNLFSFGCHVINRAYVRTYESTDCTGGVGETIKRKEGVSWRVQRIKYHMHGMTIIPDVKTFGRKFRRVQVDVFQYPGK